MSMPMLEELLSFQHLFSIYFSILPEHTLLFHLTYSMFSRQDSTVIQLLFFTHQLPSILCLENPSPTGHPKDRICVASQIRSVGTVSVTTHTDPHDPRPTTHTDPRYLTHTAFRFFEMQCESDNVCLSNRHLVGGCFAHKI